MDFRISLQRILLTLIGVFCLPLSASALPPFDITDTTSRTVVIWFDNNDTDPSSVGNDLEFAYNGSWTSNGTTGTIVVDKDDVIDVFDITTIPGTPADTANWSDQITKIDIATGDIISMEQTGTLTISGLGNHPFSYDLNTKYDDFLSTNNPYTDTSFAPYVFGETFTAWCTNENPGQIGAFFCPDGDDEYNGPDPFAYISSTGRFNAIGPVDLNDWVYVYGTFGDAQLFETPGAVPTLSDPMIAVLVLALLAIAARYIPREAGVV